MMAAVNAGCGRKGHIDMNNPLDRAAIIASLETEQGWQLTSEDESLQIIEKTYIFKDFNAAFGFMGRVALMAERANHHPEFHNRYRQVTIRWQRILVAALPRLIWKWQRFVISLPLIAG